MNQKKEPQGPAHGFDGAGHMDPAHAKRLLELGREGKEADAGEAFVKKTTPTTTSPKSWPSRLSRA